MEKITMIGAAGFIGTNISLALLGKAELKIVDKNISNMKRLKGLLKNEAECLTTGLTEDSDLDSLIAGTDTLLHLTNTVKSINQGKGDANGLKESVALTSKLLSACVRNEVKKVVFFSSGGTIYGNSDVYPIREDMPKKPISPYGMSNLAIEELLSQYNQKHGLEYRVIRLSNPYGPYQLPNGGVGAVAAFIYRLLKGVPVEIYGDGSVVRDFIYIDDAVKGVLNVVYGHSKYREFNLGSGKGTSIAELLDLIIKETGKEADVRYLASRTTDVRKNVLDTGRYEACFGPLTSVSLEEGISRTIEHIKKNTAYDKREADQQNN